MDKGLFLLILSQILMCSFKKVYKLEKTGNCPKVSKNLTIDYSHIDSVDNRKGIIINGSVFVHQDVKGVLGMRLQVQRCPAGSKKCDEYIDYVNKNFCPDLAHSRYVGDGLSSWTNPMFKCPLKMGEYVSRGKAFEMSGFEILPFDNDKWVIKLSYYDRETEKSSKATFLGCWFLQITRKELNSKQKS